MILPAITTHYSLLSGFVKPEQAAKKCKELGYTHCLLSDDSLSGVVDFFSSMKKEGIVPIIAWRADNGHYIAKTLSGYKTLIRLVSGEDIVYRDKDLQFYKDGELDLLNVYYTEKEDSVLLKILLCSKYKKTFSSINNIDIGNDKRFFDSDEYYFRKVNTINEANLKLFSELEDYTILSKPKLPKVDCGAIGEDEHLTQLCRNGWRKKLSHLRGELKQTYANRVKYELDIITKFGLSGYFLIVEDIINFVRSKGWLPGPGRGSAGGSLIAYLLSITEVDPVKYGLLFSRFLNSGRFSEGNISLPDIDMDVPSKHRDEVIAYIKNKYGHDKVYQMITFGRLQGRSAIKEVARIYAELSFSELNELTDRFPQESSISDELEEMETKSLILWTLENDKRKEKTMIAEREKLRLSLISAGATGDLSSTIAEEVPDKRSLHRWCRLDDNDNLTGDLSDLFDLAIRIEGTYKSQGLHPAAVVISNDDIKNDAPLVNDGDGNKVVGLEMYDLDKIGLTKFDVLGINLLDKIMEISDYE